MRAVTWRPVQAPPPPPRAEYRAGYSQALADVTRALGEALGAAAEHGAGRAYTDSLRWIRALVRGLKKKAPHGEVRGLWRDSPDQVQAGRPVP